MQSIGPLPRITESKSAFLKVPQVICMRIKFSETLFSNLIISALLLSLTHWPLPCYVLS